MCNNETSPVGEEKQSTRTSEMCSNKTSSVGEEKQSTRTSKRIKKRKNREITTTTMNKSLETSRKIRTKTKKPKFLSLKLEINENLRTKKKKKNKKQSKTKRSETKRAETEQSLGGEEEEQYDTVAAYLFNSTTDSTISSIHDLLPDRIEPERNNLSPFYEHGSSSSSSLLRTAMRKGASEETEERWVSYSEVVEEVMSRSGTPRSNNGGSSLALKLDYEQIMEAWSDKGTVCVDGEPPQIVPDLHASSSADGFIDGGESGCLWTVPEMETTEMLWRGHREASLLRYKEKRQNRLFSKRIRYQVRKLNAEKRPRIKGRFVKRDES